MPLLFVNFVDPKTFFYPGETIVGNIIVRLDSTIRCKKISLKFKGESYVKWTTGTGDNKKTHKNTEEYFNNSLTLAPLPPEKGITLNPGDHHYPFQFQLPNNLPPSVDHAPIETGYIRYYMKIKIDVDWWRLKSDIEEKIPLNIFASPNQSPNLLLPATITKEKFLCCLCCQSGPIRLVVRIQKQVYRLGDQLIFSFELDNKETDKPLRAIEAKLIEQFTFISNTGRTKQNERVMSSLRLSEGLPPRSEGSWNDVALIIPTHITPSFTNCKCMHLQHYFTISVGIKAAFDPKVSFPITLSSGPHMVQPMFQPGFIPGNVIPPAPGMVYPPPTLGIAMPSTAGPLPSTSYPPTTGYPAPAGSGYPPDPITQQPTGWNPDTPPPAYP